MHEYLIELLECPVCHGQLNWNINERDGKRISAAEANCTVCAADYPVRDGIGLFLTPDLPRDDLWEQVDSGLMRYLHEHPEVERQLLETSLDALAPADRFFRALVLEARGDYSEAKRLEDAANRGLYTAEYITCWNRQLDYVIEQLSATQGPIVDLASGRGYLIEQLVSKLQHPVVATDSSPAVLRRDRRRLESLGLYEQVSLLAFDARRTPFKNGAVEILTTNLGLPNIKEPGSLLGELRRIVSGIFLAVSHFYPEEDEANAQVIRKMGLETLLYRRTAVQQYIEAGWTVEVKGTCVSTAQPTPSGVVLEGARIDTLPVADTLLEWCVVLGTNAVSTSKYQEVFS